MRAVDHGPEGTAPLSRGAVPDRLAALWRSESRRILATLVCLLGDFDLTEEALQDAFAVALERWPADGIPDSPRPWLVSTARFRAIDRIRRRARFDASARELAARRLGDLERAELPAIDGYDDDHVRLAFACCDPVLPEDARIALTLREICGLRTEEIARAFLVPASTLAQRIVRAKARLRETGLRLDLPPPDRLPERLGSVLRVVYLVFSEGYSATSGNDDAIASYERAAALTRLEPERRYFRRRIAECGVEAARRRDGGA